MSDLEFAVAIGLLLATLGTMVTFLLRATDLPLEGRDRDIYRRP